MKVLRALTVATALVFPAVVASCASESDEFFGQSTTSGTGASGGGAVGGSSYGGFYNEGGDNGGGSPGVGGTGGVPSTTTSNMSTTSGNNTTTTGGGTPCQSIIDCIQSGCIGIPSCNNGFCDCQSIGLDGGFDLDGGFPDLGFP